MRAQELSRSWPKRAVGFTFDDAYLSTMTYGVEVMNESAAPGSFYAVAGMVGKASSWDAERGRPLADWDHLRSAASQGHEIGNHTFTHPQLARLDGEAQRVEIQCAHHLLREDGLECKSVCYPYGSLSAQTLAIAAELGYEIGLTLRRGIASDHDDHLSLPRVTIAYGDAIPLLLYKIFVRPKLPKSRKTVVQ